MATQRRLAAIIMAVRDRAGPATLDIVVVVPEPSTTAVRDRLDSLAQGSTVEVATTNSLQTTLRNLAARPDRRLCLLISRQPNGIELHVPEAYREVDIVNLDMPNVLHVTAGSTYGTIQLSQWASRRTLHERVVTTGPNVAIDLPDDDEDDLAYDDLDIPLTELLRASNDDSATPEDVAQRIRERVERNERDSAPAAERGASRASRLLPWLAGAAGFAAGTATAVLAVEMSAVGIFVTVGPVSFAAASVTVAGVASIGIGIGAGVAVAALVYFIPWRLVAQWFRRAAHAFIELVRSLWPGFRNSIGRLVQLLRQTFQAVGRTVSAAVSTLSSSLAAGRRERGFRMPMPMLS